MIRINLLAEEQAAEEARRRDPVKRGIWGGGFLVGLVVVGVVFMQLKVMNSNSQLAGAEAQWSSLEKEDALIKTNRAKAADIERRLAALAKLSTNRFLWSAPLNALQYSIINNIAVTDLTVKQTYDQTAAKIDPNTKKLQTPATSTEKIRITFKGNDFAADSEGNHTRFMDAIRTNVYFRAVLKKPDSFASVERVRTTAESGGGGSGRTATFSFDCLFAPKVR